MKLLGDSNFSNLFKQSSHVKKQVNKSMFDQTANDSIATKLDTTQNSTKFK